MPYVNIQQTPTNANTSANYFGVGGSKPAAYFGQLYGRTLAIAELHNIADADSTLSGGKSVVDKPPSIQVFTLTPTNVDIMRTGTMRIEEIADERGLTQSTIVNQRRID